MNKLREKITRILTDCTEGPNGVPCQACDPEEKVEQILSLIKKGLGNKKDKSYKNGWDDGFQCGYHQHKKELVEKIDDFYMEQHGESLRNWNKVIDQIKSIIEKV